jgi:hypothetical protein
MSLDCVGVVLVTKWWDQLIEVDRKTLGYLATSNTPCIIEELEELKKFLQPQLVLNMMAMMIDDWWLKVQTWITEAKATACSDAKKESKGTPRVATIPTTSKYTISRHHESCITASLKNEQPEFQLCGRHETWDKEQRNNGRAENLHRPHCVRPEDEGSCVNAATRDLAHLLLLCTTSERPCVAAGAVGRSMEMVPIWGIWWAWLGAVSFKSCVWSQTWKKVIMNSPSVLLLIEEVLNYSSYLNLLLKSG